jgi:hypothetical protein
MAQPLAEHTKIQSAFGEGLRILLCENWHFFTLNEFSPKFRTACLGFERRATAQ